MTEREMVSLPVFDLAQGATADIGTRHLESSGLPQLHPNYRTMAELRLGGGEFIRSYSRPQTVYLAEVIDQREDGHEAVMEQAKRQAVVGPAGFILLAAEVDESGQLPAAEPLLTAVAPLINEPRDGLGASKSRIVGRRGSLLWLSIHDEVPADEELIWTPFKGNLGIRTDQFEITPDLGRVLLTGHTALSKTQIKAPDVVFTSPDGEVRQTIEPATDEMTLEAHNKRRRLVDRVRGLLKQHNRR